MIMSLPVPRTPDPHDAPTLKWGILAPGWIADGFCETLRQHTTQEIAAVGSRSEARAAEFASRFEVERSYGSYEQLVADEEVDVVYVASPMSHHLEHGLLAIEAGKHVLMEKAFTRTADEARTLVQAARDAGVTLMEAMWTRFLPHVDVIRQLLADGALGELETVTADHGQYFDVDPSHRLYAPELGGGAMLDLGVYPFSFAVFALGLPTRITAVGTRASTGVERQVSAVLDGFADHPYANALVNTTLAARTPTTATISGSEGAITVPGAFYAPQQITFSPLDGEPELSAEPSIKGHFGLAYQAAHFARLAAEGERESPLLPLDESVAIMQMMDDAVAQIPAENR